MTTAAPPTLEKEISPESGPPGDARAPHDGKAGVRDRLARRLSRGARSEGPADAGTVTFSDLVRAHRAWEQCRYDQENGDGEPAARVEEEFQRKWRLFEAKYGRIDDAYWSVRDASAVGLTVRHRTRRFRQDPELVPRFHRATDWATRDEPDIAGVLDECETLAVRVEEILRGPSELIALRRIHAVASHLLGYVDRAWGRVPAPVEPHPREAADGRERKECVDRQRKELEQIERLYDRTGNFQARIVFFWGMAQGFVALLGITALGVGLAWLLDELNGGPAHWEEIQLLVISVLAGALGAILSVLSRMASLTGKFGLDHELGRKNVRWIGIYRPFVGGIFGFASYLMLASGILQTEGPGSGQNFAYYGILALFSGFFERFTKLGPGAMPTSLEASGEAKDA